MFPKISPQGKLLSVLMVSIGMLMSDPLSVTGMIIALSGMLIWSFIINFDFSGVGRIIVKILILLVPFFLTVWVLKFVFRGEYSTGSALLTLKIPSVILFRGLLATMVNVTVISKMSPVELNTAVMDLPLPPIVKEILASVIFNLRNLRIETMRILKAVQLRGSNKISIYRIIINIPAVWLPRVIIRSHRSTDAMNVRGIDSLNVRFRKSECSVYSNVCIFTGFIFMACSVIFGVVR
ncbi:MAG: hypothetical protein JXR95_00330 [Deltaproteobacteria bacterium]|nr:hypothetical protein [Deltaproteobacteria bacterium]